MLKGDFCLIQQPAAGFDSIDVDAASELGIYVANVKSGECGRAESTAEHALFLALAVARKFRESQTIFERRTHGMPEGLALWGKTACIIGLGQIGMCMARVLSALGMKLIGVVRKKSHPSDLLFQDVVESGRLHWALENSDVVFVCASGRPENRRLLGEAEFAAMKKGAILVNITRGLLLDEYALHESLKSGHLGGAGLDVFENEPIDPENPLLHLDNVIATPHVAGFTDLAFAGVWTVVQDNLKRLERGEPLRNLVNRPYAPRIFRKL